MLYSTNGTVKNPDLDRDILFHSFDPTAELNGFKQNGSVVPVRRIPPPRPIRLPTFKAGRANPPLYFLPMEALSAPAPRVIDKNVGVSNRYLLRPTLMNQANLPSNDYERAATRLHILSGPSGMHPNVGMGRGRKKGVTSGDLTAGEGLSSRFSRAVHKVVTHPGTAFATVVGKVATGGITLVTETGVLGKTAKAAGKKAEVVASAATFGGAAGFVTSGFNPAGLVAGTIAGGARGFDAATRTRNQGDIWRTSYQGAAYGAGAGVATALVTHAATNVALAKSGAAAKAAGYGAASSTATAAKAGVAGTSFLKTLLAAAAVAAIPRGGSAPGTPETTGGDNGAGPITIVVPPGGGEGASSGGAFDTTGAYLPPGYSGDSGGSSGGGAGGGSLPPFQLTPETKKPDHSKVMLAGVGALALLFFVRGRKS